ncbi:MAG: SoxR reducing system RseC family protein [Bacteroidales bacterium]|nr:SoxR reducing system RseC family protein [Bacteroidales bacterium]
MNGDISHIGRIKTVGPEFTTVEIISESACSACHAAGLCTAAEAVKKDVTVPTDLRAGFTPGETVSVNLRKSMGTKAVVLAYVVPLFILLILVVSLSFTNIHELVVGTIALVGIGLWYLVIYMLRGRLSSEYLFYIDRNKNN